MSLLRKYPCSSYFVVNYSSRMGVFDLKVWFSHAPLRVFTSFSFHSSATSYQ